MGKSIYSLRIHAPESKFELISKILKIELKDFSRGWVYEIETTEYFDFINEFLNILEHNYKSLNKIGVLRDDISVWLIYGYNGQCNLEFSPKELKRLGENDISLCISCFEVGF